MPYGWREIDIAAVAPRLISEQKMTIKYAGNTIQPNNPKLPDMLRKKSEIGRTSISKRQVVSITKMKEVKEFLREYFDVMDVPDDEDGLIAFIIQKFSDQSEHYKDLYKCYLVPNCKYPDRDMVSRAMQLMADVLSQQKDNIALIDRVIQKQDDLLDNKERLARVENFFKSQVTVFDAAAKMEEDLRNKLDYLSHEPQANDALNHIRMLVVVPNGFDYKKIPMLNGWMTTVREGHDRLLKAKREELIGYCQQCMGAIHQAAGGHPDARDYVTKADTFFKQKMDTIDTMTSLALLDGLLPPMLQYKDTAVARIENAIRPPEPPKPQPPRPDPTPAPKKIIKSFNRSIVFQAKQLESEADVDAYVEQMRIQLKQLLKGCDGIQLK